MSEERPNEVPGASGDDPPEDLYPWDDIKHLRSPGVSGRLLCVPTADDILRTIKHWHGLPNYVQSLEQEGYRWGGTGWLAPDVGADRFTAGLLTSCALHHLFETTKAVIPPELERRQINSTSFLRASDVMWRFAHEVCEPASSWGTIERYTMCGNMNLPSELAVETRLPPDDLRVVIQTQYDLERLKAVLEAETPGPVTRQDLEHFRDAVVEGVRWFRLCRCTLERCEADDSMEIKRLLDQEEVFLHEQLVNLDRWHTELHLNVHPETRRFIRVALAERGDRPTVWHVLRTPVTTQHEYGQALVDHAIQCCNEKLDQLRKIAAGPHSIRKVFTPYSFDDPAPPTAEVSQPVVGTFWYADPFDPPDGDIFRHIDTVRAHVEVESAIAIATLSQTRQTTGATGPQVLSLAVNDETQSPSLPLLSTPPDRSGIATGFTHGDVLGKIIRFMRGYWGGRFAYDNDNGQPATQAALEAARDSCVAGMEILCHVYDSFSRVVRSKGYLDDDQDVVNYHVEMVKQGEELYQLHGHLYEALCSSVILAMEDGAGNSLHAKEFWGCSATTYHGLVLRQVVFMALLHTNMAAWKHDNTFPSHADPKMQAFEIEDSRQYWIAAASCVAKNLEPIDFSCTKALLYAECRNAVLTLPAQAPNPEPPQVSPIAVNDGNPPGDYLPKHNTTEYSTLKALYELSAFSPATLKTSTEIARHAAGVNGKPESYKKAAGALKRHSLVDSAGSSGGGYWLTDRGQRVGKRLFNSKP